MVPSRRLRVNSRLLRWLSAFLLLACATLLIILRLYLLTLPIILLSIALIVFLNLPSRSLVLFNIVSSLLALGAVFSFLNLSNTIQKSAPKLSRSGTYSVNPRWLPHQLSNNLGYKYEPCANGISSALYNETRSAYVYNVTYNIDCLGNRRTPDSVSRNSTLPVVFLGDSFTFGEGLEDVSTLPNLYAKYTSDAVFNLGMHGYGTHQILYLIQHHLAARTGSDGPYHLVIRLLPDHTARASGLLLWDPHGPMYRLVDEHNPRLGALYVGPYSRSRPLGSLLLFKVRAFLSSISNEPFTRSLAVLRSLPAESLVLQMGIISQMVIEAKSINSPITFIIEDLDYETCAPYTNWHSQSDLLTAIINYLDKQEVSIVRTSEFADQCNPESFSISPYDRHPNVLLNGLLAKKLAQARPHVAPAKIP